MTVCIPGATHRQVLACAGVVTGAANCRRAITQSPLRRRLVHSQFAVASSVKFGNNQTIAGLTGSYSRAWGGTDNTMDTSTDHIYVTTQRSITVDPAANNCYELLGSVTRGTQQGTVNVNAVFSGHVGYDRISGG